MEYLSRSNLYNNYMGSVNSIANEHPVLPGGYGPGPYGPPVAAYGSPYGGGYGGPAGYSGYGGYGGY